MSSLDDGNLWSKMLPDELFGKYGFDGHECSLRESKMQTYELFWYPKSYESARELFDKLNEMKDHILFEGCNFRFSYIRRD